MGLFDTVIVEMPLPGGIERDDFQTKDFDFPSMERYRIDAEGRLFHEAYDIEDRSDPTKTGFARYAGSLTRVNQRWEPCDFIGALHLFDYDQTQDPKAIEFIALVDHGQVIKLERVPLDER